MKRAGFRVMLALLLGMALLQSMASVAAVNDTTPPVLQSLSVSPSTVVAGNSVTITARVTDDISGVNSVYISYNNLTGQCCGPQGSFTFISGTAQDGVWEAIITIPAAYASGTYTVNDVSFTDKAGNSGYASPPTPPTPNGTFTVTGGTNDHTAPVLQSLSVSPSTVAAGSSVTITAHMTDDISGVSSVYISYNDLSGQCCGPQGSFTFISGTALDGIWQAIINISSSFASGTYTVNDVSFSDRAGNSGYASPPTPPTPNGTFTVTGGTNDRTAPILQSLSVSSPTVAAGSSVTVTARVTDDISGVNSVYISYNNLSGQCCGPQGSFTFISGSAQDGIWQAIITIPAAFASGTYTVNDVSFSDKAGNSGYVSPPTPPTPNGAFTVYDPTIPSPAPSGRSGPPSGLPAPSPNPPARSQLGTTGSAPAPIPTHR